MLSIILLHRSIRFEYFRQFTNRNYGFNIENQFLVKFQEKINEGKTKTTTK